MTLSNGMGFTGRGATVSLLVPRLAVGPVEGEVMGTFVGIVTKQKPLHKRIDAICGVQ